ncbi:MAG TPA: hypothetical protein P5069_02045 [Candidatus Hydrogenedentes bacterium]|nr:hypothetical protein [Candidatus Hydrogenedentota bacterium]
MCHPPLFKTTCAMALMIALSLQGFAAADTGAPVLILADGPQGPEKDLATIGLLAGATLLSTLAANAMTVNVYSKDAEGIGFRQGTERMDRVEDTLLYLMDVLNESGEFDLMLGASESDGTGALAQGGTLWGSPAGNGAVFRRLTEGVKPFDASAEMVLVFDWGWNWNTSTAPPAEDEVDLRSVLLHEMTHGLGFSTFMGANGASVQGAGIYTNLDLLLAAGNPSGSLINAGVFVGNTAALTGGAVVFGGPAATTAFGGTLPPVYSPSPFLSGSSLQHWAQGAVPGGAVMEPAYLPGVMKRAYSGVDLGALVDLGYTGAAASPNYGGCPLSAVELFTPGDSVTGTTATVKVACGAAVTFNTVEDCLPTKNVRVTYSVNGESKGVSTDYDGGFPAQVSLPEGTWTITATAERQDGIGAAVTSQKQVTVVVPSKLQVSPTASAVGFGETDVSTPVDKAFTVTNAGGGTLSGVASLSGDEAFSFVGASDFSLTAGQSAVITVRLTTGKKGGDYAGTLRFTAGELAAVERALSGKGLRTGFLNCAGTTEGVSYGSDATVAGIFLGVLLLTRRRAASAR